MDKKSATDLTAVLLDQYNFPRYVHQNDFLEMKYSHHSSGKKMLSLFEDIFAQTDGVAGLSSDQFLAVGKQLFGRELTGYRFLHFRGPDKDFFRMDGYAKSPDTPPADLLTIPFDIDNIIEYDASGPDFIVPSH